MPGHCLFVYGTLKQESLLRRLLGRAPPAVEASLDHHRRYHLRGRTYPGIRYYHNDRVEGRFLSGLSAADLRVLDRYEGNEYRRARVRVNTPRGRQAAWAYVLRRPA